MRPLLYISVGLLLAGLSLKLSAQSLCVQFSPTIDSLPFGTSIQVENISTPSCEECGPQYLANHFEWEFDSASVKVAVGPGPHDIVFDRAIGMMNIKLRVYFIDTTDLDKQCIKEITRTIKVFSENPVEMTKFVAQPYSNTIGLKWEVLQEQGNKEFVLEYSKDSVTYEFFSLVSSKGDHQTKHVYQIEHEKPVGGDNFYRISYRDHKDETHLLKNIQVNWYPLWDVLKVPEGLILVVVKDTSGHESFTKIQPQAFSNNVLVGSDPTNKLDPGRYQIVSTSVNLLFNKELLIE